MLCGIPVHRQKDRQTGTAATQIGRQIGRQAGRQAGSSDRHTKRIRHLYKNVVPCVGVLCVSKGHLRDELVLWLKTLLFLNIKKSSQACSLIDLRPLGFLSVLEGSSVGGSLLVP